MRYTKKNDELFFIKTAQNSTCYCPLKDNASIDLKSFTIVLLIIYLRREYSLNALYLIYRSEQGHEENFQHRSIKSQVLK